MEVEARRHRVTSLQSAKSAGNNLKFEISQGMSLTVAKGEIVAIVGPSGAGKTTLLQIIGTLDRPDQGSVLLDGRDLSRLPDRQLAEVRNRQIGFVFQFHQLLPEFTAVENVMMPALIARRDPHEAADKARRLLDYLQLSHRYDHKPSELSGGEKQRVAVARALMNDPSVILADEPSGSLDSRNRDELHRLLLDVRQQFQVPMVIVTHDQQLASLSDRILEMRDGRIQPPTP